MRHSYWSNTKLADWIRGLNKPTCATSEDWNSWHKKAKTQYPIRYFIAEELLEKIQSLVYWPVDTFYNIKHYIKNRWVDKTHMLKSSPKHIKPGRWCDLADRFLPCLFDELVDFVEIENAAMGLFSEDIRKKYPTTITSIWPLTSSRNPAAGIAHLEWAASLVHEEGMCNTKSIGKPTTQALAAQEVLALYKWWTTDYPNRVEPYELSGWSAYCDEKRKEYPDDVLSGVLRTEKTPAERALVKKILNKIQKIEASYEKEDEEMLIRLIRIRNYLWT